MNNRIHWRDFVKTRAYAYMQFILKMLKYQLVIEWKAVPNDTEVEAEDVYITTYKNTKAR